MAVFTALARDDITRLLAHYAVGELREYSGIAAGIENTNYFVTTTDGEFVLTLFERLTHRQLPFYLELMRHLARRELPVPLPAENTAGSLVSELRGKPAAIVGRRRTIRCSSPICAALAGGRARCRYCSRICPRTSSSSWSKN
jgi:homoserine kinase type II